MHGKREHVRVCCLQAWGVRLQLWGVVPWLLCPASRGTASNISPNNTLRLMIEILSITLRTLNYGIHGIFLIMGNAGFISSTVSQQANEGINYPS